MKVLVANRGEIAIRIMRACREMGIATVAVYSTCDRASPHVGYADQAYGLGGDEPAETYLHIAKLIAIACRAGADAVHPGYGFLAENAGFARACLDAGLTFIGPAPGLIALMGSKTAARKAAIEAGVPVVPGTAAPIDTADPGALAATAADVGFPLLVKAVAGGGGKGMRLVTSAGDLPGAVRAARSEAMTAFGDGAVYLERRLEAPRHVEIQLLADHHGAVLPFVERECSIQRRHQKVLEEAPSVAVDAGLRRKLAEAAAAIAARVGYRSAGTVEFLLDQDGRFYFLEMNTRLQVEHPVTEMITGIDLVQWQIRIARGDRLDVDPARALTPRGHAIECRIYAEDPDTRFMPSPGRIVALRQPAGPGVRDDSGVATGFSVPIHYDSMISKLIAWGEDRPQAISRLARALTEYEVLGIRTTIPFFRWLLDDQDFLAGRVDTTFLDRALDARGGRPFLAVPDGFEETAIVAAAIDAYLRAGSAATAPPAGGEKAGSGWRAAARAEGLRS